MHGPARVQAPARGRASVPVEPAAAFGLEADLVAAAIVRAVAKPGPARNRAGRQVAAPWAASIAVSK